jgi:hypothetical protein
MMPTARPLLEENQRATIPLETRVRTPCPKNLIPKNPRIAREKETPGLAIPVNAETEVDRESEKERSKRKADRNTVAKEAVRREPFLSKKIPANGMRRLLARVPII